MFSRLSGIANTVLHELSGDGEGSENARDIDPGPESGNGEAMSEDQMERLTHYEQLVVQLKGLIQQKDAELQRKDGELQQKESQIKVDREASDAKFAKLKLQAKAKVTALNKQIEELKKTGADQIGQCESENQNSNGQNESSKSVQDVEDTSLKLQDTINDLTRQLNESHNNISALAKQLSDSQETIAGLTKQLQDSQESVHQHTKALQESQDVVKSLQEKQELEIYARMKHYTTTRVYLLRIFFYSGLQLRGANALCVKLMSLFPLMRFLCGFPCATKPVLATVPVTCINSTLRQVIHGQELCLWYSPE